MWFSTELAGQPKSVEMFWMQGMKVINILFLTELRILIRVFGRIRIMFKNLDSIQLLSKLVAIEKLWYHI